MSQGEGGAEEGGGEGPRGNHYLVRVLFALCGHNKQPHAAETVDHLVIRTSLHLGLVAYSTTGVSEPPVLLAMLDKVPQPPAPGAVR